MAEYINRETVIKMLSFPITMSMCVSTEECEAKRRQREHDLELIKSIPVIDVGKVTE